MSVALPIYDFTSHFINKIKINDPDFNCCYTTDQELIERRLNKLKKGPVVGYLPKDGIYIFYLRDNRESYQNCSSMTCEIAKTNDPIIAEKFKINFDGEGYIYYLFFDPHDIIDEHGIGTCEYSIDLTKDQYTSIYNNTLNLQ